MHRSMKVAAMLLLLPLVLGALERVNLLKNAGFEREDEAWHAYTGMTRPPVAYDSAKANAHDPERAFTGSFSASVDTRTRPGDDDLPLMFFDSAVVIQGLQIPKTMSDLDSLIWRMKIIPRELNYKLTAVFGVSLSFDRSESFWKWCRYSFHGPAVNPGLDGTHRKVLNFDAPDDTSWLEYRRLPSTDWLGKGILPTSVLDSIAIVSYGGYYWLGQKVYWDDVQLMGYADYDVGVKEILSGDSIQPSMIYIPEARIKNFGRENAPEFYVIAEVWEEETRIYYDSLPWSLDSDTEDIVSFKELILEPPLVPQYTLTIRTVMEPDECDEDDQLSKFLIYTGIAEAPTTDHMTLEVRSLTTPLRVAYSLPYAESGTLTLYDAAGRKIERLTIRGSGEVSFSTTLPSGVYFVRLESADLTITRKAVLLR